MSEQMTLQSIAETIWQIDAISILSFETEERKFKLMLAPTEQQYSLFTPIQ